MCCASPLFDDKSYEAEFGHLKGTHYLDQTGAALYPKSLLEELSKDLTTHLYRPLTSNLKNYPSTNLVDSVRNRVLQYFNTTSSDYSVIFTSGATQGLKYVADNFNFFSHDNGERQELADCGEFVYLQDNHTSVLGMRNVDNIAASGVPVRCVTRSDVVESMKEVNTDDKDAKLSDFCGNSLFVYPAQCNFSGVKNHLRWIKAVQKGALEHKKRNRCKWYCLLDSATFVSTNPLDLNTFHPDFVVISFYKMFGLPTGLGALIVRNRSVTVLCKHFFKKGSVQIAPADDSLFCTHTFVCDRLEDGPVNMLRIVELNHALDWWLRSGITAERVSEHCFSLASYTYSALLKLHHSNGQPVVHFYADTSYDDQETQGGIINFNIVRESGSFVGHVEVLNLANLYKIHLRTGCFCNPGACQRHLGITEEHYYNNFLEGGHVCGDEKDLVNGLPTGSVRVSFGPHSRPRDADKLIQMISECFVSQPSIYKELEDWQQSAAEDLEKSLLRVNLMSENHYQTKGSESQETSLKLKVSRICLYPIKSCGSFEVLTWIVDSVGLRYDRNYMVVTSSGVALTQKQEPRMCLIKPIIDLKKEILTLTFIDPMKDHGTVSIPLDLMAGNCSKEMLCKWSRVCSNNVCGIHCGEKAAEWLSKVLGRPGLYLINVAFDIQRTTNMNDENSLGPDIAKGFSNQSPFLLINQNSALWLLEQLPEEFNHNKNDFMDRFRSNFVIEGNCPAFYEQNWKKILIGSLLFQVDGPCGRCQMICIDQSSGISTKEPLTTLAANCRGRIKFGIYLSLYSIGCNLVVRVGDEVVPHEA